MNCRLNLNLCYSFPSTQVTIDRQSYGLQVLKLLDANQKYFDNITRSHQVLILFDYQIYIQFGIILNWCLISSSNFSGFQSEEDIQKQMRNILVQNKKVKINAFTQEKCEISTKLNSVKSQVIIKRVEFNWVTEFKLRNRDRTLNN
ncbi:unnamed protein product [Paramecium octaurelia]|uniref:Uncharacterized protein n=1 Tax=Paramecium octaurelia TaxID=43137 RepID=A0A8S1WQ82_PAROT|nr:unnamed protein product [Paramecium octaurelia]